MPIRKEFRHLYSGPEWKRTRLRILKRAGNQCEFCGRPNRKLVLVTLAGEWRQQHRQSCEHSEQRHREAPHAEGLATNWSMDFMSKTGCEGSTERIAARMAAARWSGLPALRMAIVP